MVYAAYHWRHSGLIRFNEFRGLTQPSTRQVSQIRDGWIELFEKKFFDGRFLTLRGSDAFEIADFGEMRVQGSGFDNKVRSVRFQLPIGARYRLFRRTDFKAKIIDLIGTGGVSEIADLREHVEHADVSSARFHP